MQKESWILPFGDVGISDVPRVGGKNASLGEMHRALVPQGVRVPGGFAVTAEAYRYFLAKTGLREFITSALTGLDTKNLRDLARRGKTVREKMSATAFPDDLAGEIRAAYAALERKYGIGADVAVRSSATAEDLPDASFAGEHETYLNIRGGANVLSAIRLAMASLFTDRAISYRADKGFDHFEIALSVGVQKMVRSDRGASGVMFTLDTESGFRGVIIVNASWGLGEMVVKGEVTPDEYLVAKKGLTLISKRLGKKDAKMIYSAGRGMKTTRVVRVSAKDQARFALDEEEINTLARWGQMIEDHYSSRANRWMPMDIEWAKDGVTNDLYIVQARPETVHARRDFSKIKEYVRAGSAAPVVEGASVGSRIATGAARVIMNVKDAVKFKKGEVLVTGMTDPDWEPIMKMASAIVTDKGGRTSHAAIVSRELGIPCVVGTGDATARIKTGETVTVDTTGSAGAVFRGALKFTVVERDVKEVPETRTRVMLNIATPESAFAKSFLPNRGVGLAREEFIIASEIGIHPLSLVNFKQLPAKLKREIEKRAAGFASKEEFYVRTLAYGIATIAAAFDPHPVIVRFSDFKTNEYRSLLGGERYEPVEENPMIGWRGASRYYDPTFRPAFAFECRAMRMVREAMGFRNVIPMVPFCRTPEEADKVLSVMASEGLDRAKDPSLKVYVMCEIPSNVILAEQFLERFDGMSIGSNDLTQLALGLDRDAGALTHIGNETNDAVKALLAQAIRACKAKGKYVGICGQGPSDYPELAAFLVGLGIDSISLNPDTVITTTMRIAEVEAALKPPRPAP